MKLCAKHPELEGERYDGDCIACKKERARKDYAANREKVKARSAKWRNENRDRHRAQARAWYTNNTERARRNIVAWQERNPDKVKALGAERARVRAARVNRLPLTEAQKRHVRWFYNKAQELRGRTGEEWHVDHILPIARGGLHHPANLQVLRARDNRRKSAKLAWGR